MERNTLIAIVLSVAVLFAYQTIFVPPKRPITVNNSQTIAKESVSVVNSESSPPPVNIGEQTTNNYVKVVNYDVTTPKQVISYTNVGGSLHKIDFLQNAPFPVTDVLSINGFGNVPYVEKKIDDRTIVLTYKNKNWEITKTYELAGKDVISARMEIKNISEISILENLSFKAFQIDESDVNLSQSSRDLALYEYSVYANGKIFRKGSATKFGEKNYKSQNANINWVGFRDRYNAVVIKPEFETKSYEIKADNDRQLNVSITPVDVNLAPGQSAAYNFSIYEGPQNPWLMKTYNKGFEKIVAFSNFAIVEWIAQGIYYLVPLLHKIFRSWGVAIIIISAMVYGITYPLTMKSMMSMRKMQEAQPKIKALQERYKNEPQKLQTEMMEIYRREKINPFGGCLPFIIQMPFFLALYQILWRAQYFQGQGFLWIKDLSQPDRLITMPFYLPFFGNELNILPILTGCVMFLQQRISSKNMVVTDDQQAMQQKMMMYILPVMMACMFYKFASSWALYFLVYYLLTTGTQLRIAHLSGKK